MAHLRRVPLAVGLGLAIVLLGAAGKPARKETPPSDIVEVVRGTNKEEVRAGEPPAPAQRAGAKKKFPKVEVYVTDWCPYCQQLEAFLKHNGVPYVRKNIEERAQYRKERDKIGDGIPVTRIGTSQIVSGFQREVIARALGLDLP